MDDKFIIIVVTFTIIVILGFKNFIVNSAIIVIKSIIIVIHIVTNLVSGMITTIEVVVIDS